MMPIFKFYAGTSGVALFLALLYEASRDADSRRKALGAVRHAVARADSLAASTRLGLCTGWTGIALAAAIVGARSWTTTNCGPQPRRETLRSIASHQGISVHKLVSSIDHNRIASSLISAIRAYAVTYLIAITPSKWLPEDIFH